MLSLPVLQEFIQCISGISICLSRLLNNQNGEIVPRRWLNLSWSVFEPRTLFGGLNAWITSAFLMKALLRIYNNGSGQRKISASCGQFFSAPQDLTRCVDLFLDWNSKIGSREVSHQLHRASKGSVDTSQLLSRSYFSQERCYCPEFGVWNATACAKTVILELGDGGVSGGSGKPGWVQWWPGNSLGCSRSVQHALTKTSKNPRQNAWCFFVTKGDSRMDHFGDEKQALERLSLRDLIDKNILFETV